MSRWVSRQPAARQRPRNIRSLWITALSAIVLGAAIVAAIKGQESRRPAEIERAGSAVFPLLTEVEFDTGENTPGRATVEGTGTVLFGRYVLTAAHAVTQERLEMTVRTPRGDLVLPVMGPRVSERTWLLSGNLRVPLTPVARDEEADLALFRLPDRTGLASFPYPVGDSETLRLGDPIAVLGADPVAGPLFRPGSVAGLHGSSAIQSVTRGDRVFLMSLALASGESGAPILAARGGSYELVGVAQGTYIGPRQLAWAIRIGPGLESLSRQDASDEVRKFVHLCRRTQVAGTAGCAPDGLRAEGMAGPRPSGTPPFTVSVRQKSPLKPPGFRP